MLKSNLIKLIKKIVRTTKGKPLLSILLLICVLTTKGLYDNNMQAVQAITQKYLVKSNISTTNTKNIKHFVLFNTKTALLFRV